MRAHEPSKKHIAQMITMGSASVFSQSVFRPSEAALRVGGSSVSLNPCQRKACHLISTIRIYAEAREVTMRIVRCLGSLIFDSLDYQLYDFVLIDIRRIFSTDE